MPKTTISAAKVGKIAQMLSESARISQAAIGIANGADYCDFFVENGGDGKPFHEKCPSSLTGIRINVDKFSDARMSRLSKLGLMSDDGGYCDFFVENGGDGKPFHEKCSFDAIGKLAGDPVARAILLSRSQVVQTLQKVIRTA